MSLNNSSASSRFGHSNFLRSSAVYGSAQGTVFSETSTSAHLKKAAPHTYICNNTNNNNYSERNSQWTTTYQQASSAAASRTTSPARQQQQQQQQQPAAGRASNSPARNPIIGGGGNYNADTNNNGGYSPYRLGGGGRARVATPERARSPPTNPITGDVITYSNHNNNNNNNNAQQLTPQRRQQNNNNNNYYYIGSNANSRTNSPIPSGSDDSGVRSSRASSITGGGGSSIGDGGFLSRQPPQQQQRNNNNNNSNNYGYGIASSPRGRGSSPQRQQQQTTTTTTAPSALAHTNNGVRRAPSNINQHTSFHISQCGPPSEPADSSALLVGRSQRGGSAILRRASSQPRPDPAVMAPAGVATPRERFGESPKRTPSIKNTKEVSNVIFGGSDAAGLIFGKTPSKAQREGGVGGAGGDDSGLGTTLSSTNTSSVMMMGPAAGGSSSSSRYQQRSDTPPSVRLRTGRRIIEPPVHPESNSLWVRTKNKGDVVLLGVRGRGAIPPPDNKFDEKEEKGIVITRKIIPQQANIAAAACQVVGAEIEAKKAKHNPLPSQQYRGFVVPPYRVDKETLPDKVIAELGPEVFMEPFGQGYRHRRHFDPADSVREDLKQSGGGVGGGSTSLLYHDESRRATPTRRLTAQVEGKGPSEPARDLLNLSKYTPEELGERPSRHSFMAGPPAFVPEPVRPYAASANYRPHRAGTANSRTNNSSIDFGITANVSRAREYQQQQQQLSVARNAADSPLRSGGRIGVYSPARNLTPRPF